MPAARADDRAVDELNFGLLSDGRPASRASRAASTTSGRPLDAVRAQHRPAARRRRGARARPRHRGARRHRLGRRDPHRARGARGDVAGRADRPGGEPALRRPRERWRRASSAASPPGRTGSSSRPNAVGEKGALKVYGKGEKAALRLVDARLTRTAIGRVDGFENHRSRMSAIDYSREDPEQRQPRRGPHAAARARALAAELPQLVGRHGPRRLARLRRLPAHGDQRRPAGLGALRLREDAATTAGASSSTRRSATARSTSASTRASRPGRTCPASTAPTCAASSSRRATPSPRRSSSSATSASPRRRMYDLRNLFQINVEEGRHLWAMVYLLHKLLRPRRPRGGRGAARAPLGRRRTTRASSARSTRRRPTGSRSSCSRTSPTATASSSSSALAESALRSAGAHDEVHADRGSAPHVRRRVAASRA